MRHKFHYSFAGLIRRLSTEMPLVREVEEREYLDSGSVTTAENQTLFSCKDCQGGWWPGETPFEVALGAIFTQNTNWQNVTRVITALKAEGSLDPVILGGMPEAELAQRFRPAGYYNLKARRVKNFLAFFAVRFDCSTEGMATAAGEKLRDELLSIKGIGPETADSILLYALHQPTFVVDAYTFRILSRHGLVTDPCSYEELRLVFMDHLPAEVPLYQEFHALLVRLGKEFCRPQPRCVGCPLENHPCNAE